MKRQYGSLLAPEPAPQLTEDSILCLPLGRTPPPAPAPDSRAFGMPGLALRVKRLLRLADAAAGVSGRRGDRRRSHRVGVPSDSRATPHAARGHRVLGRTGFRVRWRYRGRGVGLSSSCATSRVPAVETLSGQSKGSASWRIWSAWWRPSAFSTCAGPRRVNPCHRSGAVFDPPLRGPCSTSNGRGSPHWWPTTGPLVPSVRSR